MTTPTKEQIIEVMREATNGDIYPLSTIELVTKCIIAWEKIKKVDVRVEERCKNNPGTKDFVEFLIRQ